MQAAGCRLLGAGKLAVGTELVADMVAPPGRRLVGLDIAVDFGGRKLVAGR